MKLWSLMVLVLALTLALAGQDADARRLGGGRSVGQQSGHVTQREAARAPGTGTQNANQAAPAQPGAAAAGAASQARKPWGGLLGGIAAGLGLAWLAHTLGFGAAFGQFLLIALIVLVALVAWGALARSRRVARSSAAPFAFEAAAPAPAPVTPRQYSPNNVGNDASARPWERSGLPLDAMARGSTPVIGSALGGAQTWGIPAGFDADGFLAAAKRNFVTLQAAWDRSDVSTLRTMMTDSMLGEIKTQLAERETHAGGQPNHTEVVMLQAQLLGIEDLGGEYLASVEFSGMIREEPSAGPSPFREVWNMSKPKDGASGWLVAGVQALQ
ncbi:MAG: Tim44-like domain-containing protein [Burkholderiaceae bacterium]|jgi:predicted lipid-binding transport protein (Tim44 family)|nr:MAG: Tim44-like domain-containing protein [Burkholderiaceae bacterium]